MIIMRIGISKKRITIRYLLTLLVLFILLSSNATAEIWTTTASNTVVYSDTSEQTSPNGVTPVLIKSIPITNHTTGTIRFNFSMHDSTNDGANGKAAYARIYKNGIAIGTTRTSLDTNYVTYSEDIVVSLNKTDTIELWGWNQHASYKVYVQGFLVQYNTTGYTNTPPSVPTTNSHLAYFDSADTTVTWIASTDVDDDTSELFYGVKVGTSSGATDVLNYNDTDTISNTFTMVPENSYYYSVRACDPYECSAWSAEKSFDHAITTLYTPTNLSTQYKTYPPLTSEIAFTWSEVGGGLAYNLKVAKDINFDLLAVDITTSNNYSTQSLAAGNYWWKVQYYNNTSLTYYNWSNTFNFTLTSNVSATGTGIHGVVYELNGVQTPLTEATVYIQHSAGNWSSQMTTGSNGYYLFSNLTNNTIYYVYAVKKDYQNSATEYVTTGAGNITTRDILLRPTEPTDFESDKQYVKFTARWLWCLFNCNIEGATISAYNYGDVIAYASGVTDSTGSVSFRLYKTQRYRVTVVNSTAGISQEMTLYPKDSEYVFLITNAEEDMQEHETQEKDAIKVGVTKAIINTTHATITVNYTDSLAGTTALTYYINQSNSTVIQSWTWDAGSYNHTFLISGYSGQSYMVNVVTAHAVYGTIDRSYAVPFEKTAGVGIDGIPSTLWLWFAIGMMFFTGAMFTASTVEKGLLIVVAEGWIFFFMGMFSTIDPVQFTISLTLASVIAVFAYFKRAQAAEGYS